MEVLNFLGILIDILFRMIIVSFEVVFLVIVTGLIIKLIKVWRKLKQN